MTVPLEYMLRFEYDGEGNNRITSIADVFTLQHPAPTGGSPNIGAVAVRKMRDQLVWRTEAWGSLSGSKHRDHGLRCPAARVRCGVHVRCLQVDKL